MVDARPALPLTEPRDPDAGDDAVIDEAMIARVVDVFYARAREDALLGPVFNARVADWPAHLANIRDFWSAAALRTGRYRGKPAVAHALVGGLSTAHFARWVELWAQTTRDLCPPAAAATFVDLANRMARGLTAALRLPPPAPAA